MTSTLLAVVVAALWFLVFVVAHIAGLRAGFDNARWLLRCFLITTMALIFTVIAMSADFRDIGASLLAVLVAVLTSACLLALYIPALYTVLTSVSVETMMFLSGHGDTPESELYGRFAGCPIMQHRTTTLSGNGYVERDGPPFRLTSRGRRIATIFAWLKAFWKLGPSG